MEKYPARCSICGKKNIWSVLDDNNAWPVTDGRCCSTCNWMIVIPRRMAMMRNQMGKNNSKKE